jgi:hypothetical protein
MPLQRLLLIITVRATETRENVGVLKLCALERALVESESLEDRGSHPLRAHLPGVRLLVCNDRARNKASHVGVVEGKSAVLRNLRCAGGVDDTKLWD